MKKTEQKSARRLWPPPAEGGEDWVVSRTFTLQHPRSEALKTLPESPIRRQSAEIRDAKTNEVIGRAEQEPCSVPALVELRDLNSGNLRYVLRPNLLDPESAFHLKYFAQRFRLGERVALLELAGEALRRVAHEAALDPTWGELWFFDLVDEFHQCLDAFRAIPISRRLGSAFKIRKRGRPHGGVDAVYFLDQGKHPKSGDAFIFDAVLRLRKAGWTREKAFAQVAARILDQGYSISEARVHQIYDGMRKKWVKDHGVDPEKGRTGRKRLSPRVAKK